MKEVFSGFAPFAKGGEPLPAEGITVYEDPWPHRTAEERREAEMRAYMLEDRKQW